MIEYLHLILSLSFTPSLPPTHFPLIHTLHSLRPDSLLIQLLKPPFTPSSLPTTPRLPAFCSPFHRPFNPIKFGQARYCRFQPHIIMHLKLLSFAALATLTSAQSLTSVLTSTPELSTLTGYVSQFPDLVKALGTAKDITILAPTNAAFGKGNATALLKYPKLFEAGLTYHVLQGIVPASDFFKSSPSFIPTELTTPLLTNVTGGQVVEGVVKGKSIEIVSGLRSFSSVVKGVSVHGFRERDPTDFGRISNLTVAWSTSSTEF